MLGEFPLIKKSWKRGTKSVDVVFPNKYYGGVYNLAIIILYNIINQKSGWLCNRIFLDKGKITSKLIGFTFQYELDYYNFFKILKANNINPNKNVREEILFGGGPCINTNVQTLSKYIDFFIIGDCEIIIPKVLEAYEEGFHKKRKSDFLKKISKIKGVYVPKISKKFIPAFAQNLDKIPYPFYQPLPQTLSKEFVFGKSFMLEIERGCAFKCKFCLMPNYYQIVKFRSLKKIKEIVDSGIRLNKREKVVIYSASFSHPQRKKVLQHLISKGLKFSIPSMKVDLVDEELLKLIKAGGQKTLTIAPECNERLRKMAGKPVSDEKFFQFAKLANKLRFETLKCYFMIGLPGQKKQDLDEMLFFIEKVRNIFKNKVYISVNPFVAKPRTAFANHRFDKKIIKQQAGYLKKSLRNVKFKIGNINTSYKEWKLSHTKKI